MNNFELESLKVNLKGTNFHFNPVKDSKIYYVQILAQEAEVTYFFPFWIRIFFLLHALIMNEIEDAICFEMTAL